MYAVTVTFTVNIGDIDQFLPLMVENANTSLRDEAGCQQFDVCRDKNVVFLYEIYDNKTAFEIHLRSAHFKTFDAAVSDMIDKKEVVIFEEVIR